MIAPLTLRDLSLVKRLQSTSVVLCPIEMLTRPQPPLWEAVASLLPFGEARQFTFVLDEPRRNGKQLQGFAQVRRPPARPEMHIQRLAPRLDANEDAHAAWGRLLNHLIATAGGQGVQRLFACGEEGSQALELLLGAGFSVYTREEIFRLAPDAHPQARAQEGIRPEQSVDFGELSTLYRAVVPHLVQQAEPLDDSGVDKRLGEPITWGSGEGFVLQDKTGIAGYGHLMSGRAGHWLSVLAHPRAYDQIAALLDYGLALLNYYPPRPVYCAVREYQGGLRAPLQDRGFEPLSTQCRLVRHTTVRVKESARGLVPALEKRVEAPTTTVSTSEGPR